MKLNTPRTLNIFTDASIVHLPNESVGCAGAIAYSTNYSADKVITDTRIVRNSTNNNSEITAILLGVIMAISNRNGHDIINIFSDSKICIIGLKEWIFNWVKSIDGGVMISSSGKPVANQDIIVYIVNAIVDSGIHINFYHQNGHIKMTEASLLKSKNTFMKSNKEFLDDDDIKEISRFNDIIDNHTRNILCSCIKDGSYLNFYDEKLPIIKVITNERISRYAKLINSWYGQLF